MRFAERGMARMPGEGVSVVFATRGIMKEWGEILKRKSMRLHTQVSWTTGLQNNFLRAAGDASLLET